VKIHVVFDGPPGPDGAMFVEVEDTRGNGIDAGEWVERDDGLWALEFDVIDTREKP
jgi:hypothetical protein